VNDQVLENTCRAIRSLEEERAGINQDIADCFARLKACGYDTKIVRQVIKRQKMAADDRAEADARLEAYETALAADGGEAALAPAAAKAPSLKQRQVSDAIALAQISRMNRGLN